MFYVMAISAFLITDQLSKFFTVYCLNEYQSVNVIDNILSFTHVHNTGGPWSMLDDKPLVFIILTIIILVLGIYYFWKNKPTHILEKLSVAMIAGGALGNFTDRIFRGYVVDMIDVNFFDYPVFNLADCYIVIGAVLMCIYVIFIYKDKDKTETGHGEN